MAGRVRGRPRYSATVYCFLGAGRAHVWYLECAVVLRICGLFTARYSQRSVRLLPSKMLTIAIDGPAGAGKSTVSKMLARRLGLALVDTGALYRSIALKAGRQGVGMEDEVALGALATSLNIRFAFEGDVNRVFVDGDDVTDFIRTPEVAHSASKIAAWPAVRSGLLSLQRQLAAQVPGAVLEGRDIGTVVLPHASAKFFLTAPIRTRVQRRFDELVGSGGSPDWESLLATEIERDRRDSERAVAPLKQAEDALLVDSSELSAAGVVDRMVEHIRSAGEGL